MNIDITIKNYRCFSDQMPVHFSLRKGFTAFTGINNSGKSSALKLFYELRPALISLLQNTSSSSWTHFHNIGFQGLYDYDGIFNNSNNREINIDVEVTDHNSEYSGYDIRPNGISITFQRDVANLSVKPFVLQGMYKNFVTPNTSNARIDYSILQSAFQKLTSTLYIGPFRNILDFNQSSQSSYTGSGVNYFDIKSGEEFIRMWRTLKTGSRRSDRETAYQLVNDVKNIFGLAAFDINTSEDGRTIQLFVDGKSYTISELGAGITQFIVVLTNAAVKRPAYIMIDEPELNLHPSLQLDFLTTLGSYATEGVLFATHNLGLARAGAERVYSVHRHAAGYSEISDYAQTPRLAEFVGELSFAGYRELGFDKILLVEGPSELRTIQQLLRLYGLDHQVVLLPMGGAQMDAAPEVQLTEIRRISENVFALVDSERSSADAPLDPKRQAFLNACQATGVTCCVLERRATENYLTDRAVKKVKGDNYRALTPYELLKNVDPHWRKSENWLIAREMTCAEIDETDLGCFLASLRNNGPGQQRSVDRH